MVLRRGSVPSKIRRWVNSQSAKMYVKWSVAEVTLTAKGQTVTVGDLVVSKVE
jgi:hypothetical protein